MTSFRRTSEATPRSKPGRPRRPAATRRSWVIGVRVSDEEKSLLEKIADGQKLSAFLRDSGLKRERPGRIPLANRVMAGQLARWGNNLNQLVRLVHSGRIPAHFEALLQRMYRLIVRWRREQFGYTE